MIATHRDPLNRLMNVSDLWRGCVVLFEQGITQRLLLCLINVSKPQNVFSVGRSKVEESLVHRYELLSFPSDEKNTVSVNQRVE